MKRLIMVMGCVLVLGCNSSSNGKISATTTCEITGDSAGPGEVAGIINGQTLAPDARAAKGVVYIFTKGAGMFHLSREVSACTGILVSDSLILTAAHCVRSNVIESDMEKAKATRLVFSANPECSLKKDVSSAVSVTKVIPHPDYNASGGRRADLALIFLSASAPAGSESFSIDFETREIESTTPVHVVGYGRQSDLQSERGRQEDFRLRFTTLFPSRDSVRTYQGRKLGNASDSELLILDSDLGSGVCSGDSGGPALILKNGRLAIQGIASFVYDKNFGETTCLSRVAYTKTSAFREWILKTAEGRLGSVISGGSSL